MTVSKYRKRRQDKYQRRCARLAVMRAAKARKREARIAAGWEPEPRMERWHRFEIGFRDTLTGIEGWKLLTSARNAHKTAGLILKFCQ